MNVSVTVPGSVDPVAFANVSSMSLTPAGELWMKDSTGAYLRDAGLTEWTAFTVTKP